MSKFKIGDRIRVRKEYEIPGVLEGEHVIIRMRPAGEIGTLFLAAMPAIGWSSM